MLEQKGKEIEKNHRLRPNQIDKAGSNVYFRQIK